MKTYEAPEQHDWTSLRAQGKWVVCEQLGVIAKTRTGIHVPDNARMAVWVVYSAGDEVKRVRNGDRVLFVSQQTHNVDGRMFCILQEDAIMATLSMPVESETPDDSIPEVLPPNVVSGRAVPKIIMPS